MFKNLSFTKILELLLFYSFAIMATLALNCLNLTNEIVVILQTACLLRMKSGAILNNIIKDTGKLQNLQNEIDMLSMRLDSNSFYLTELVIDIAFIVSFVSVVSWFSKMMTYNFNIFLCLIFSSAFFDVTFSSVEQYLKDNFIFIYKLTCLLPCLT